MFSFFFLFPLTWPKSHKITSEKKKNNKKKKKKKKKKNTHTYTIRRNWNKLIINSVHHENIFYTSKYIQLSIELGVKLTFDIAWWEI